MAHEILLRAYKHGHDMGGKKLQNMGIWLLGRTTLLEVAFFGFSNSVSKVKRYVQCCAVGTDSRYLSGRGMPTPPAKPSRNTISGGEFHVADLSSKRMFDE